MDLSRLSDHYSTRPLGQEDADTVCALCQGNPLFYQYHPPFVTRESILEDLAALPPGKSYEDKFYFGFFTGAHLVAVMDLVLRYPDQETAFIGFFMVDIQDQGKGTGTEIISGCAACLREMGFRRLRLGVDKGNPQSFAFWTKNGFTPAGENDHLIYMDRRL